MAPSSTGSSASSPTAGNTARSPTVGAPAFWPAAAAGGGNNVAGLRPAASFSGLRRSAASPGSRPEGRRTDSRTTAHLSFVLLITAAVVACTTPSDDSDRTAELTAREAGNPGGENFGEFGPPDAYEGDNPHPFYGAENEWSRRMFDERSADLYYKRRGQRQLLEILDGNPARAIELADARLADDADDAESHFIRAVALTQLDRIGEAEGAMQAALDAGMPFGRFLAGPRELLAPLAATATFALHAASPQNAIVHGPMLGAVTDTSARVWVRTAEATSFQVIATATGQHHTASGATTADRDFTGTATLEGLSPDTTYSYQVRLTAPSEPRAQPQPGQSSEPSESSQRSPLGQSSASFQPSQSSGSSQPSQSPPLQAPASPSHTLRTAPSPGTPGTFTIAFGGCAGYTPANERMWDTIAGHDPHAFLILGDNVYIDLPEQPGPFHDYTYYQRQSRPEFRRLVSATSVYAIWDDHDAAVDDIWLGPYVDRPAWKQPMVDLFRRNWNNPAYGSDSHPGVWFGFSLGDVDFFLLDGRTYRTNPFDDGPTMLGPDQKAWLLESLGASEATFKVIASPVAWADGAKPGSRDTWSGYPEEREEIFRFIEENGIAGVVLLSSDRHRSEAWAIERESGYAFHDLLSGQLTNIHTHPVEPGALFSYNLKDSFGLLTFETAREDPRVTYEIHSIDDELVETFVIPHADLAVTKSEGS